MIEFENCTFHHCIFNFGLEQNKKFDFVKSFSPKKIAQLHYECLYDLITEHHEETEKNNSSENLISTVNYLASCLMRKLPEMREDIIEAEIRLQRRIMQLGDDASSEQSNFYLALYNTSSFRTEFDTSELPYKLVNDIIDMHSTIWNSSIAKQEFDSRWNIIRNNDYGDRGNFAVECMEEVLSAGEKFWRRHGFTPTLAGSYPPEGMTCAEWVITCDAIGQIVGLALGAIGSIMTGALFSIAAERECEDRQQQPTNGNN